MNLTTLIIFAKGQKEMQVKRLFHKEITQINDIKNE